MTKTLTNYPARISFWFVCLLLLVVGYDNALAKELAAQLEWHQKVSLSFRINGVIESVKVSAGDLVKHNTILVQLDPREYQANLTKAKAKRTARKSELEEAQRELERDNELYDRTVLSEHELQLAKNHLTAAKSAYQNADANWIRAKLDMEAVTLRAPYDAVVLEVKANRGETIVSSFTTQPVISLAEQHHMVARGYLDEASLQQVKQITEASVKVAGQQYPGRLSFPSLMPASKDKSKVLYPVAVVFAVPAGKLRAGMKATILLP